MSGGQRPAEHGELDPGIADRIDPRPDSACETVFEGHVWDVTRETFTLDGNELTREVVRHPGAVAVVALRGEPGAEQVLLIEQYRHPVGTHDWEMWDDGWTVVTKDRRRSAQFEHTILVTDTGSEILTVAD